MPAYPGCPGKWAIKWVIILRIIAVIAEYVFYILWMSPLYVLYIFTVAADMNRQPNKRRKRKPASSSGAGANALGGSAMGGRIKRSPDPQNFTPILGVCSFSPFNH